MKRFIILIILFCVSSKAIDSPNKFDDFKNQLTVFNLPDKKELEQIFTYLGKYHFAQKTGLIGDLANKQKNAYQVIFDIDWAISQYKYHIKVNPDYLEWLENSRSEIIEEILQNNPNRNALSEARIILKYKGLSWSSDSDLDNILKEIKQARLDNKAFDDLLS